MNVPKLRFKEFNDEWQNYKVEEILKISNGINKEKEFFGSGTPIINYMDVNKNELISHNIVKGLVIANSKELETFNVKKGDILFTRTSETSDEIGLSSSVIENIDKCIFSGFILKGTQTKQFIHPYFGGYYFRNPKMRKEIIKHSSITTRALTSGSLLSQMSISIPTIIEQEKIGKTLSLLDKKVELQAKKIEDLKLFKLYTKNQIFKDYDEIFKLKDILVKWNKKNKNNSVKYVESISNKYGFISQSDQFEDRNVASKDLNNYYIIEKGVFGYNPSRLNVGSLALKTNDKVSVVSPLYECFTTSQNNQYLLEWFDSKYFRKETISKFEGGVRNTLNFSNLCEIEIGLPTIEKQNKYSKIFKIFNNKIEFEVKKLYKLQELKKGLMQSIFV